MLGTGFCFGLPEDAVGLFPWQDGERWDIGHQGADFYPNKLCHTTISRAWVLGMLSSQSQGTA